MAFVSDPLFPQMDNSDEWVDFDQFLDLPSGYDDQSTATTISPQDLALSYEGDFTSPAELMEPSFDMFSYDLQQQDFMGMGGFMQDPAAPLFDDASFAGYNPYDSRNSFRSMVEAQAAADPRTATIKEKRREAAIALHLQRLCDATALDLDMSSDSNTSFSSPSWSDYVRESTSPRPSPENASISEVPPPGGMEMVLDLNMNATANVPKKQKPRSQAQKENYIKARKYGACEKHKKQHKRCNCLEKAAARAGVSELPTTAAFQERPRQPMLQVPILPEARYSGSPGHDPSSQSPQALPSVKPTCKPTSSSSGHDILIRVPVVPRDIARTKTQKSSPTGLDVRPGGSGIKNVSGHDMILLSDKLAVKNTSPAHDKVAPPGRNITSNSSAGHDTLSSGISVKNNASRNAAVPGKRVFSSAPSGHDMLIPSVKNVSSTAGVDQGHDPRVSMPQTVRATGSVGFPTLRWRVTSSSSGGVLERTSAAPISSRTTNLPSTGVSCTPSLHVRPLRTTRSSGTVDSGTFVPGTIAANLGIRQAAIPVYCGTQVPGPDRNTRSARALTTTTVAISPVVRSVAVSPVAARSVSKAQVALPHGLGSPDVFGNRSPVIFGNGIVQSVASRVDGLFSGTAVAAVSVWQAMSFASQAESLTLKLLSLSGRFIKSTKGNLVTAGLWT